jgi:hypothetical protein
MPEQGAAQKGAGRAGAFPLCFSIVSGSGSSISSLRAFTSGCSSSSSLHGLPVCPGALLAEFLGHEPSGDRGHGAPVEGLGFNPPCVLQFVPLAFSGSVSFSLTRLPAPVRTRR